MGSEYQALIVHSSKRRRDYHHFKGKHSNSRKYNKDISKYICFTCDERRDTLQEIVPRIRIALTRRKETREDIMLMMQRMMNLPQRESNKKVMILQVMKNMF